MLSVGHADFTAPALQIQCPSGLQYYVGESDNVRKRLARHIAEAKRRFQGPVHAALVAGLARGEKSLAKKAEALTIQALMRQVCARQRAKLASFAETISCLIVMMIQRNSHPRNHVCPLSNCRFGQ